MLFSACQKAPDTDPGKGSTPPMAWGDIWVVEPQLEYPVYRCLDVEVFVTHFDGEDNQREIDPKTGALLGIHYAHDEPEEYIVFDETHQLFGKANELGEFWLIQDTSDIDMGFVGVSAVVLDPDSDYTNAFDGYIEVPHIWRGMAMMYNQKLITPFEDVLAMPHGNRQNQNISYMRKNMKWAFLDKTGTLLTNFCFDNVDKYVAGIVAVEKSEKWGFVTELGETVIPFIFDSAVTVDEDTAFARYEGKTGILDKKAAVEYFKDHTK